MSMPCSSCVCIHHISGDNLGLSQYHLLEPFYVYISVTMSCRISSSITDTSSSSPRWIVISRTEHPRDHMHNSGLLVVDFTDIRLGYFTDTGVMIKSSQCQWIDSEACRQINHVNYTELLKTKQKALWISYAMWCFTLQAIRKLDYEQAGS